MERRERARPAPFRRLVICSALPPRARAARLSLSFSLSLARHRQRQTRAGAQADFARALCLLPVRVPRVTARARPPALWFLTHRIASHSHRVALRAVAHTRTGTGAVHLHTVCTARVRRIAWRSRRRSSARSSRTPGSRTRQSSCARLSYSYSFSFSLSFSSLSPHTRAPRVPLQLFS